MKVRVLYFASLREALGLSEETIDTDAQTIGQLRRQLMARGDIWAAQLADQRPVRMAVDQQIVDANAALGEMAEVAFFPPVTGG